MNTQIGAEAESRNQSYLGLRDDNEYEFLQQSSFAARLGKERQRAERSGRSFALMLAYVDCRRAQPNNSNLLRILVATLGRSIRKTDIAGWQEDKNVIGVIFTEFGQHKISDAIAVIEGRVGAALNKAMRHNRDEQLRICFHIFPEEWNYEDPKCAADSTLYPDLPGLNGKVGAGLALKRCIDICGSLLAILLLSPIFLTIAAIVRLTSKGPVLFRQVRIGQYGVPFTFYKFRSMYENADSTIHENYIATFINGSESHDTTGVFKIVNDPRVTRIGRFLRKTSLDELPQFFNVLSGKMSLVGPRPPIPYEVKTYTQWHRQRMLQAKPGITGLWQVSGRSRVRFDEMVRLDLRYAAEQSIWLDLSIIARTPRAVFSGRGAC
jgi:lipopolysaccharide/colanic/teichoic acid biosynthesis glycosyltransferase